MEIYVEEGVKALKKIGEGIVKGERNLDTQITNIVNIMNDVSKVAANVNAKDWQESLDLLANKIPDSNSIQSAMKESEKWRILFGVAVVGMFLLMVFNIFTIVQTQRVLSNMNKPAVSQ